MEWEYTQKLSSGFEAQPSGHSSSLGLHTTVFQVQIYAIKADVTQNIQMGYTGRNIYTLSDSPAAINTLDYFLINSKLVWESYQSMTELAEYNTIQLVWLPGHLGIDGN